MQDRLRCRRCHATLYFCPCCGAALNAAREVTAKGHHRPLTPLTAATVQSEAGNAVKSAWMQHLPARPVSAYEVYEAEQLDALRGSSGALASPAADSGGPKMQYDAECASPHTHTTVDAFKSVDPTSASTQEGQKHQRIIAVAWLRLSPPEKQHYEEVAQWWAGELQEKARNEPHTSPPVHAGLSATERNGVADVPAAAAVSADATTASSACQGGCKPIARKVPSKKSTRASGAASRATCRTLTSFNLFRLEMKARRWSVAEAAAVWQQMSPQEKGRYDAAAASCRTEGLRPPPLPPLSSSRSPLAASAATQEERGSGV
ncbi:hypothetical protein ABB37_06472 [Leptomonas pyrrhocoris]|uniref:Uncharacterized protein n=1 Tax=Leptomonas pyrrhocoris TaxID=157538 RepID=A0A0M9FY42_LEPPY|nr:hypothetical protein ABB37_06472 [Leptomonas pyrrhocoris]KPA78343.1 hypothetical protein ABB37_06472 [Leptomonas pyrrhocoris]|eukprot:XP_015656782.1 hypothetical protein ABB37_06472 [Leptomonas pyrrhocoris]